MDRKTFFNEMAASWDERFYTGELLNRLSNIVSEFRVARGERILDVGTGTGGIIPYLLDASAPDGTIHAVDYAPEMIRIAQKKFYGRSRVTFHVTAVESLPFEDLFFDRIICFGAFPHFEDKTTALNEMHRVLKRCGKLIIAHALSSAEIKNHHRKAEPVKDDCLPEETTMRRLLRDAGFVVTRLLDQPGLYICEGVKQ